MRSKSTWVRLSLIAALLGSWVVAGSVFAQGSGAVVRVDPASATATVGQTLSVSIKVDNVSNMAGAEIHLSFNASVLEVVDADSATAGVQIANGGMLSADFVAQNTADNAAGTIDFAIAQMNKPAVNGSGTLATISFKAKAVGTSPVAFRGVAAAPLGVILADTNGAALAASTQPGSVTVGGTSVPPSPTPTPTTTPLPGSGTPGKHVVQAGETLYCIGRAYGVSPWAIASANNIFWPYRLFIGRILTILNTPWTNIPPGKVCVRQFAGTPPPPPPTPTPGPTPTPLPGCKAMYTVVRGDTLSAISRKYNVNLFTLGAKNNIFNLNLIFVGQVLCIPQ